MENVAVCPAITAWLDGCPVIDGATGAAVTVSIAALLVTLPELSVTTTVNEEPLSELVVTGVVYDDPVAPLIAVPFFFH
jgi:hypothetical protein